MITGFFLIIIFVGLLAGSRALSIEALGRGAGWVDFVEKERRCCAIIRDNLEKTGFNTQAHVYCASVTKAITFLDKEYGIILMDPPYSDMSIGNTVTQLAGSGLVGKETTLFITHSPRLSMEPGYGPLCLVKEHRHGDSMIAIYRKGESS